jgi:hypothetical protein
VAAIVGIVLSYAALVSGNPGTGSSQAALCSLGGDACEAVAESGATGDVEIYATPVEVNCPAIIWSVGAPAVVGSGHSDASLLSGGWLSAGCSVPKFDFRYRVSRFADSERSSGGLAPQRGRRAARTGAVWTGLPRDRASIVRAQVPPAALYAQPGLMAPRETRVERRPDYSLSTRIIDPLDRPPRR